MEQCVELVRGWMAENVFKLTEDTAEVLFLRSPNLLSKLQTSSLNIGSEQIVPKDVVRNIGAYMVKSLNMEAPSEKPR